MPRPVPTPHGWGTITAYRGDKFRVRINIGGERVERIISGGTVDFGNTIVAGNTATAFAPEINLAGGTIFSLGNNLVGDSAGDAANTNSPITYQATDILDTPPLLDALGMYGGTTPTRRLQATSPAIDKGVSTGECMRLNTNDVTGWQLLGSQPPSPTPTALLFSDASGGDVSALYQSNACAGPGHDVDVVAAFQIRSVTPNGPDTGFRVIINDGQTRAAVVTCAILNGQRVLALAGAGAPNDPATYLASTLVDWFGIVRLRLRRYADGGAELVEVNGVAPSPRVFLTADQVSNRTRAGATFEIGCMSPESLVDVDLTEFYAEIHTASTDQRGLPRPVDDPAMANAIGGDGSDIGAYEVQTPAPPETQNMAAAADKATYSWSAAAYATQYDVVRGDLGSLPVGPGGGDEVCFDNLASTTLTDPAVPAPGTGYWYLSRGENAEGIGTFGTRSDGTQRFTTTCP